MSTLSVTNVSKEFPTRGEPLQVLRDVSLELKAGENLAILGPSGCGKSTLLHLLGTLDPPTTGTIELDGQDPFQLEESQLARFRNENIGFIFQEHHLLSRISHRPAEVSGGERERAAVARSLLHRPLLLLADEPTGNLDRTNAQQVAELLLEIQQHEQTMLIVVTHNNELADQLQKQTTLDNGQLS